MPKQSLTTSRHETRHFARVSVAAHINAPVERVRRQFADLDHHIACNVHPKLTFRKLYQTADKARFEQTVRLLGMRQRDLFDRTIHADGSMTDLSIDGANKGGSLRFRFEPKAGGTDVSVEVRLPVPRLLGFLRPVMERQVRKEVLAAVAEDQRDLENGAYA